MKNRIRSVNWDNFIIELSPKIFSKDLLKSSINHFWNKIVDKKLNENQHILFLYRVQWADKQIVTINNLITLNKEDKNFIINLLLDLFKDKGEYYLEQSIVSITISYGIRDGRAIEKSIITKTQFHNYQHHKLPITMDPLEYGKLIDKTGNKYIVQINEKNLAIITSKDDQIEVKFFRSGNLVYQWVDKWINKDTFQRILGRKEFIFKNNELFLFKQEKSVKFIKGLKRDENINNKIITLDIETYLDEGVHIPYCISFYDGENIKSFYLTDFKSSENMIIACIENILIRKYDNFKVYIHNLAGFDAIFLLKILAKIGQCKPIIHNDKIISIQFKLKNYLITFKDSYQMLLGSLARLGKSFGVLDQKSIFPYLFVNENNLGYVGEIPDLKYFSNISSLDYNCYIENYNNWSMRDETIRYCEIDCISLYQVLFKFNELIFNLFSLNIFKFPTLSSLAFAIYRSNFIVADTIPQISGQVEKDIRMSYTGGAVDMYIPMPEKGVKLYGYDVNSLYPYVMEDCYLPVGEPTLFEGNIKLIDPDAFGFFYCNIIAPEGFKHPIIQTHVKTSKGTRTIAPLGAWSDMIFSPEMDNAIKFGYKFEILWGYTFQRRHLFKDYVNNLYNLRLEYPRSNPMNYLAKILLNSLYGRFGMEDNFFDISIWNLPSFQ